MSEINKNNLEEFFSNSMEQFNDSPSDRVWEGISDRLDEEDRRPVLWWRHYPLMVLPIMVIGALALYSLINRNENQKIIDNPIAQKAQVKETIDPIKQNYEIVSDQMQEVVSENVKIKETDPDKLNSKTITLNPTSSRSSNARVQELETNSQYNSYQYSEQRSNKPIADVNDLQNEQQINNVSLNNSINDPRSSDNEDQEQKLINEKNNSNSYPLEIENKQDATQKQVNQLFSFPILDGLIEIEHDRKLVSPPIVKIEKDHWSKYRVGLSGRFANTFVSDNKMFNGNESYGLRQEYYITKSLAITNAIHFNIQHYDIESSATTIEPVVVQRYTSRSFDDSGGLQKIESNSEYVDLSLGLKYELGRRLFGFKTFINPSFVGQVYMPQTFKFLDLRGDLRVRENKSIVMYLGSANLNIGVEKQLNKHIYFQVSLWGEHSFIPIGLQREKIQTIGISTSLLFGK